MTVILIGLFFTFLFIVNLVGLNFQVILYICSLCFLFQFQHILSILAIRKKNSVYAKCLAILTLIKTVITLLVKLMNDKIFYRLPLAIFVILALSFILQVNITLPKSFKLEKVLLERAEIQKKLDIKIRPAVVVIS